MKKGDAIGPYVVTTEPVGMAKSEWAEAEKGGKRYHLKRYLAPTMPKEGVPGPAELMKQRRAAALAFESRHRGIQERLAEPSDGSGHLVVASDFFRDGGYFYKATELFPVAKLAALKTLGGRTGLTLIRSMAFSLDILHRANLVHGDIKPDNALIVEVNDGIYVVKLIDFDSGYFAGDPPPPKEISGMEAYFSPELLLYQREDPSVAGADLHQASDMFALGLWIHIVCVGSAPSFDRARHRWPAEAVVAGDALRSEVTGVLGAFLEQCWSRAPGGRPTAQRAIEILDGLTPEAFLACVRGTAPRETLRAPLARPLRPEPTVLQRTSNPAPAPRLDATGLRGSMGPSAPVSAEPTALRGSMGKSDPPRPSPPPRAAGTTPASSTNRLRGTMGKPRSEASPPTDRAGADGPSTTEE